MELPGAQGIRPQLRGIEGDKVFILGTETEGAKVALGADDDTPVWEHTDRIDWLTLRVFELDIRPIEDQLKRTGCLTSGGCRIEAHDVGRLNQAHTGERGGARERSRPLVAH